ncbi:hypothetical protein EAS64_36485 [Trebonia kvetii]|uniref:Uncharacterized protein n=1 Tax=Trebonia kvetii TaxID=2480626 RepID=A0A6P2BRL6_9ACTN|nr:hypothetical protein [Trebonia kvetii]TVZ00846.1 hypothetical protein EAS64_36485 [Trebonia kvetii]
MQFKSRKRIAFGAVALAGSITAASLLGGTAQAATAAPSRSVSPQSVGTAAATSPAGSIVYLKGGNVWIAHADGTHARQFTTRKLNWSSPSEADNASKIAYGIWECGDDSYTALWTPATATGLKFPSQTLGQEDFYEPYWINNSEFVVSHAGPTVSDSQARWFVHKTTQADDTGVIGWNWAAMTGTGAQAVLTRSGSILAVFEDDAAD